MARSPLDTSLPSETIQNDVLFKRQSTLPEVAEASFEQGIDFAETSSIVRMLELSSLESEDDITNHQELNKMFPQIDVPFNKPTSLAVAEEMAHRADKRMERATIIANGDPDSIAHSVVSFGANMIPQALDPIGIVAGIFVGGGIGKAIGMFKNAGKAAQLSRKAQLAKRMAEGVVGNVISEVAIVNPATRQEQADVDTYQSLSNAVIGGLAFPVILTGLSKSLSFIKDKAKGSDILTKATSLVEAQMQMGKRGNADEYINAERQALLPELRDELSQMEAVKGGPEMVTAIDDLRAEIAEIEGLPKPDRQKVAEKANSPEEDLYHNPEAVKATVEAERNLDTEDIDSALKSKLEESDDLIDTLKKEGVLEEADIKELETIRAELKSAEKVDEMMKAATVCLRGK